jgi:hypothetical protein
VNKPNEKQAAGAAGTVPETATLYDRFNRGLAQALAIAGGGIIPVGLIISAVFGGWRGLAGAFVGFGVASLYAVAALSMAKWALKKPAESMPVVLLVMFLVRLVAMALVLFGLTYATAINRVAIYACFLALFLAYTVLEIAYAWKTFGVLFKPR